MGIPSRWLRDYVDIEVDGPSIERLAERLTLAGLEVEEIRPTGTLRGVVVGRVTTCRPHPNSDHLSLCQVDGGGELVDVVCGASNVCVDALVPLARVGAELPSGFRIEKRKVRGEVSHGMICSKAELGLEDHSEGIWIFDPRLDLALGADLAALLEYDDYVLDIKVTSNRPDCDSVYGVAREVAAVLDLPLRPLDLSFEASPAGDAPALRIEDPHDTPRFTARRMDGVAIGPSPLRVQHRLIKSGMRPVSNAVDATNYVMLELGQPIHPYDADLLHGTMGVRRARDGETVRTLDGVTRPVDRHALLITDDDRPIGLAGVMGGQESEIRLETTRILVEIAVFDHNAIRQTSRSVGLRTEASQRFERRLSPEGISEVAARVAHWLQRLTGCRVAAGMADAYSTPPAPRSLRIRAARAGALLGMDLDAEAVAALLRRLQIAARVEGSDVTATIPSFRADLEREADLIEEVGRIHGYDRLVVAPPRAVLRVGRKDDVVRGKDRIRRALVGLGMDEVVNDGFDRREWREAMGLPSDDLVKVRNPMAATQAAMRDSLLPGLLATVDTNLNRSVDGGALFELGRIFSVRRGERESLAGAVYGRTGIPLMGKERVTFRTAKGFLDRLFAHVHLDGIAVATDSTPPYFHPGRNGVFLQDERPIGRLGELHPELMERFAVPTAILLFELEPEALFAAADRPVRYRALPLYPAAKRDLSLSVPADVDEASVRAVLAAEPAVESVFLYDLYVGEQVGASRKSLAYELALRAEDRTLTDADAAGVVDGLARRLAELDVHVRSA